MARIRSVSPDICTDQGLVGLSGDAERLYVRLWTHLDDDGRCEDDLLLLKAALFPRHRHIGEDEIEGWLDELVLNGQLIRYERGGRRLLTAKPDAWAQYQKPRRKIDSKLPAPTRADIVGTRSDSDAQCPPGGVGGEVVGGKMEMKMEGESEGEPEFRAPSTLPVDNPAVLSLVDRAASRAFSAPPSNANPAAGGVSVPVRDGAPCTTGEAS
jgi:hypothetical protein